MNGIIRLACFAQFSFTSLPGVWPAVPSVNQRAPHHYSEQPQLKGSRKEDASLFWIYLFIFLPATRHVTYTKSLGCSKCKKKEKEKCISFLWEVMNHTEPAKSSLLLLFRKDSSSTVGFLIWLSGNLCFFFEHLQWKQSSIQWTKSNIAIIFWGPRDLFLQQQHLKEGSPVASAWIWHSAPDVLYHFHLKDMQVVNVVI